MVPPPHSQRRRQRPHDPLQTATTVAAAAVAAYGTYRLASWAWDSYWNNTTDEPTDQDAEACVENSHHRHQHHGSQHSTPLRNGAGASPATKSAQKRRRHALIRQHRITRCRSETVAALSDFLPTLKQSIESATDFSSETAELKQIRRARGDRLRRRMETDMANGGGGEVAATSTGEKEETSGKEKRAEEEEHAERRRETDLWETIKVRSLSRLLVTVYGHSLLLLVLTVQVHLLGGRLFREEEAEAAQAEAEAEQGKTKSAGMEVVAAAANADGFSTTSSLGLQSRTDGPKSKSSRASSMPSYQATHRTVLTQTYGHFFASGLAELLQFVEEAVSQVFEKYDVTDPDTMNLSDEEFNGAIDAVRSIVEESGNVGSSLRSALVRYIVQPEEGVGLPPDVGDAVAAHILEETWDILESPAFAAAERDVLDLTYGMLREGGWGGIFPPTSTMMAGIKMDVPQSPQASNSSTRPLAQIVTQLRRTTNTFYAASGDRGSDTHDGQPPNVYLPAVDRLPALLELGDVGFN